MIKLSNDNVIPSATEDEEAARARPKEGDEPQEKEGVFVKEGIKHFTRSITDDPKQKQDSD